ncbi:MAG: DUF2752 domain-containing protein [Clostridiales bacterium]|nr:DUF2752 domain-containing protein [Clostridiales bacterium]
MFKDIIIALAPYYPRCNFNYFTGLLCPGCGNTRSVLALINGDIITALRYNISAPFMLIVGIGFYIELILWAFGKHKKIVPRSTFLLWFLLGTFFVYSIVRNIVPLF